MNDNHLFIIIPIVFCAGFGAGIWFGMLLGFSRAAREAAVKLQTNPRPRLAGWCLTAGGGLGLLVSAGTFLSDLHFAQEARPATGTVTEIRSLPNPQNRETTYTPTFRFADETGQAHTVASSLYQSPPAFQVGDRVPVLYLPANPQSARINTFSQMWLLPLLFGILGGVSVVIGQIVLRWPQIRARFQRRSGPVAPV